MATKEKAETKGFDLDSAAVANKLRDLIGETIKGWLAAADKADPATEKKKKQLSELLEGDALTAALESLPDSSDNVADAKETIALGMVALANEEAYALPIKFKDAAEEQKRIDDIGRKVLVALRSGGVDLDSLSVSASEAVKQSATPTTRKPSTSTSTAVEPTAADIAAVKKAMDSGQAFKKAELVKASGLDGDTVVAVIAHLRDKNQIETDGAGRGTTYTLIKK